MASKTWFNMHRWSDAAVGSAEHPVRLLNETNGIELDHLSRNRIAVAKLSDLLMYQLACFLFLEGGRHCIR